MRGIVLTCALMAFLVAMVLPASATLTEEVGFGPRSINKVSQGNYVSIELYVWDDSVPERYDCTISAPTITPSGFALPAIASQGMVDTDVSGSDDTYVVKFNRSDFTALAVGTYSIQVQATWVNGAGGSFDRTFNFKVFMPKGHQ